MTITKTLFNALKLIKRECEKHDGCDTCPFLIKHENDFDSCFLCKGGSPCDWNLSDFEVNVRPKAKVCTCCVDYPNTAYQKRDSWKCKDYYRCVQNKDYVFNGRRHKFVRTKCVLKEEVKNGSVKMSEM